MEDSTEALKLKDDYIKAYHRRGKAYAALNKFELAIRDFQYILEKEPHNKDAMQEVKSARKKLDDKLLKVKQDVQFVRVPIEEESEEDDNQVAQDALKLLGQTFEEEAKKDIIKEVGSKDTDNWWKKGSENMNYDDYKVEPVKEEEKFHRVQIEEDDEDEEEEVKNEMQLIEEVAKQAEEKALAQKKAVEESTLKYQKEQEISI